MNSRVTYSYRDASNYKRFREVVLAGEITAAERATVMGALDRGEFFLPAQVGLDVLYSEWETHDADDDHPWHELVEIEVVPAPASHVMTASQFAAAFAGVEWDLETAQAALDEWMRATPAGA